MPEGATRIGRQLGIVVAVGLWLVPFAACVVLQFVVNPTIAHSQKEVPVAAPLVETASEDTPEPQRAFTLPVQKTEINDNLADFDRHAKKETWERAFKSLQQVFDANPTGLLPRGDGLMVPSQVLIRQALIDLPPDGRDAYRLFHDPQARDLLAQADRELAGSAEELDKLTRIYNTYFITSYGATAADRLGDLYFEQGEFGRAVECWRAILAHHPDTELPRVRLLVKSALGFARGLMWDDLRAVADEIRERHTGETVTLGGQEVDAVGYVEGLLQSASTAGQAGTATVALPESFALPQAKDPVWQFRLLSAADAALMAQMGMNWGWGRFPVTEMVPPTATDGVRVYVNLLGYHLAVDAASGKLLWRSGKFHDVAQKVQQGQYVSCEQYGLALAGERLWSVYRDPAQLGQPGVPFRLGRLDPATGQEAWNTSTNPELQTWNLMGTPVPVDEMIAVAGIKPELPTELHVLGIRADDGKLLWTTHLGTHIADQTQMYYKRAAIPAIVAYRGKLYVETHAGALVQVDAATGAVDWGIYYDSEVQDQSRWGWWGYEQTQALTTAAAPLIVNGMLFNKGMSSKRINAIDLSQPTVAWRRQINQPAMLIGADSERLYLGGEDLEAIDLKTRSLLWATTVPVKTGFVRPLLTQGRLYQFSGRGVYEVDAATGDVLTLFRGADLDSLGGAILRAPSLLLTVSNLSISAYRLEEGETATAAAPSAPEESGN